MYGGNVKRSVERQDRIDLSFSAWSAVFPGIRTNNATENNIANRNYDEARVRLGSNILRMAGYSLSNLAVLLPVLVSSAHFLYAIGITIVVTLGNILNIAIGSDCYVFWKLINVAFSWH